MKNDPWEMKSLADEAQFCAIVKDHARLLRDWESRMQPVPEAKVKWGPA